MEFKSKTLGNGLNIIGEVNASAKSAAVGFFVRTGSRDETANINGVSHFLEHMLFKGTSKLSAFEVNQAFDRTGAQFNAFTSEENTVYYAAVLPEYLTDVTKLWIQLMRPALRNEDFDIEKNVIKEEIAMYKDLPNYDVIDRCRSLHFNGHPCSRSVLGSEESIDDLTAEQMRAYFTRRYAPNNMVVACAGNLDWDRICTTLESGCNTWQKQVAERELEHFAGTKKKEEFQKPNLARAHICLMSPGVSAQDRRRFAAFLLASVVGDSTGSRFFWELVDKALAEAATMHFDAMDGTGVFTSYISCAPQNVEKVLQIIARIFADIAGNGISHNELTKAKNKLLSALVIKNELPMSRLLDLGANWIYLRRYRPIEQDIKDIKAVTTEDVNAIIREFDPADFTQLCLGSAQTT